MYTYITRQPYSHLDRDPAGHCLLVPHTILALFLVRYALRYYFGLIAYPHTPPLLFPTSGANDRPYDPTYVSYILMARHVAVALIRECFN